MKYNKKTEKIEDIFPQDNIPPATIEMAEKLLSVLRLDKVFVCPVEGDGVQIEFQKGDHSIEIGIYEDETIFGFYS